MVKGKYVSLLQLLLCRRHLHWLHRMEAAPEVAFFQAVKARLNKFTENTGGSEDEHNDSLEVRVKQKIDGEFVDIFDVAGIQKPDISVLSKEFLMEMKGYQHRNIALETLKKLLSDEIRVRSAKVSHRAKNSWIC